MNYRSVQDMNQLIARHAGSLARQFDLVVGVPRSGLLAANLMALHTNLPLTDVQGLIEKRLLGAGRRLSIDPAIFFDQPRRVLVIDDSLRRGIQMRQTRQVLAPIASQHELVFAAVYGMTQTRHHADLILEHCQGPRVFEWNLMHHRLLVCSCVDIDGVLCVDPTEQENDDGLRYERFVLNAQPLHLPTKPIGRLVTSRLEKYRRLTEQWLDAHGIQYGELIMLDLPSKAARVRRAIHGQFKGEVYRDCDARLFVESSARQAPQIADIAAKPVMCIESGQMLQPGIGALMRGIARQSVRGSWWSHHLKHTRLARWLGHLAAPETAIHANPQPEQEAKAA